MTDKYARVVYIEDGDMKYRSFTDWAEARRWAALHCPKPSVMFEGTCVLRGEVLEHGTAENRKK